MFFGLFSSHLPFIILGAVYFVTFAFASVQRMANADDELMVEDYSDNCLQIVENQIFSQSLQLNECDHKSAENQTTKAPQVVFFYVTKPDREKLIQPFSPPPTGIIFTRPPPTCS
jgi:hypothetical protein